LIDRWWHVTWFSMRDLFPLKRPDPTIIGSHQYTTIGGFDQYLTCHNAFLASDFSVNQIAKNELFRW
jgi:hypothetical protein